MKWLLLIGLKIPRDFCLKMSGKMRRGVSRSSVSLLHKVVSVVLLDLMQVSSVNYGKTRSHLASKYSW